MKFKNFMKDLFSSKPEKKPEPKHEPKHGCGSKASLGINTCKGGCGAQVSYYKKEDKNHFICDECKDDIEQIFDSYNPYESPECEPDNCFGECGGGGDCEIAEEWQERIHPPMIIRKSKIRKAVLMEKKKNKNKNKKKKKHKRKLKKK